jgi:hypothetical protein
VLQPAGRVPAKAGKHVHVRAGARPEEIVLAKPNYSFEKRQRELAKKKKQEQKRQQRLANKAGPDSTPPPADTPPAPADTGTSS